MRRLFISILFLTGIGVLFFSIGKYMTGTPYSLYKELSFYRRVHPEILPDTRVVRLSDAGHSTTYASLLWIDLIQYIGDNTRNNMFLDFLYPLVDKISDLHPYFVAPYNLATLLAPNVDKEFEGYEKNKVLAEHALRIGENGLKQTCNQAKIALIAKTEIGSDFWEKNELKNPCKDGMLPYYTAYVAERLGEKKKAESYYKIASLNHDAPQVSRFLMLLAQANDGDRISAAERFLLIGVGGYDESPYTCGTTLGDIIEKFGKKETLTETDVGFLKEKEKTLTPPKDTKNPLSSSVTGCYESGTRAIKQFYLAYIDEASQPYPQIDTGSGLIASGALSSIPTLESQKGWSVRKKDGTWRYTNY